MCKAGSSELLCVGCKSEFSRTGLASLKHCLSRWQLPPQILTHTLFPKRSAKKNTFYGLGKIWVLTDKQVRTGACSSTCVHTPHVTWLQLTAASSLLSFPQHSAVSQLLISCNISIILRRDVRKKRVKEKPACCEFQKTLPHLISTSCHKAENPLWVTGSCTYVIHSPVIVQLNILSWYSKWILMCFQDHNKTFNMWKT